MKPHPRKVRAWAVVSLNGFRPLMYLDNALAIFKRKSDAKLKENINRKIVEVEIRPLPKKRGESAKPKRRGRVGA